MIIIIDIHINTINIIGTTRPYTWPKGPGGPGPRPYGPVVRPEGPVFCEDLFIKNGSNNGSSEDNIFTIIIDIDNNNIDIVIVNNDINIINDNKIITNYTTTRW